MKNALVNLLVFCGILLLSPLYSYAQDKTVDLDVLFLEDMNFSEKKIDAVTGYQLTVNLTNRSNSKGLWANFVLLKKDVDVKTTVSEIESTSIMNVQASDKVIGYSQYAKPGETVTVKIKVPEPGVYYYVSSFPKQWPLLQGELHVTD